MVASRLVEKGVFVSIAAGNQGVCGPGFAADGASGSLVTGVGSLENDLNVHNNLNVNFTLPDGTKIIIVSYAPTSMRTRLTEAGLLRYSRMGRKSQQEECMDAQKSDWPPAE